MPQAASSWAIDRPTFSATAVPFRPAMPPSSSMRPSRRKLGQAVQCGGRSRWTRPPSWSMEIRSGPMAAVFSVRERSATCSGSFTLRAKRITPPTPRRINSSSSGLGEVPWIPTVMQRAACRSNWSTRPPRSPKTARTLARRDVAGKPGCCAARQVAPPRSRGRARRKRLTTRHFCLPGRRALGKIRPGAARGPERFAQVRKLAVFLALFLPLAATASPADRETLRRAVEQLLAQPPLNSAHVGVQVESLEDGQVVFARNGDDLLNPASNTKLITSAASLLRLGPEYRFSTDYLADRAIARGRIGTLYVRGRGDPAV